MNLWVPPKALRRVGHVIWPPLAVVLTAVLVPFYLIGAVLSLFTRRKRLLRAVSFAMAYIWMDVAMVVGCWWLWLRQPLPSRDRTVWHERHSVLLARALTVLAKASRSMLGYRVVVDACPLPPAGTPLLVLSRHAGPGDSFTLVNLLLKTFGRRPKVVLKAALQWDPGIDLLLNRLDAYFLPSGTGAGDDKIDAVRHLAGSLEPDEALLIFPEGGNWTPKRHERAVRWLRSQGELKRAAEAEKQEFVLPPRPGGVVATLGARPDLDVVVIAHAGLDELVTPVDIWDAIPVNHQPMVIHWWVAAAADVPRDEAGILAWVDDTWSDIDHWIEAEHRNADTLGTGMPRTPGLTEQGVSDPGAT